MGKKFEEVMAREEEVARREEQVRRDLLKGTRSTMIA